jgi:FkbM family methyltransferase
MVKTLKLQVQRILRALGVYQRLRASIVYDLYWRFADRSLLESRLKQIDFYRSVFSNWRAGSLIFDIGANCGSKTSVFLSLGARVLAVEPDELNQTILKDMFLRYRLSKKPVVIVGKAISDQNGLETMWVDECGSAKNSFNKKWVESLRTNEDRFGKRLNFASKIEVETTTLDDLIRAYGVPFFVKIDVEGHEINVLRGMNRAVPYLSFEVNLPDFRPEGLECLEFLDRLEPAGRFNYVVDCKEGLVLREWLSSQEFACVLRECSQTSIEVFWKTAVLPRTFDESSEARAVQLCATSESTTA